MAKLTLTDIANLNNQTTVVNAINANNAAIEAALENTLSRDGTSPNQMNTDLDMNSYRIVNLADPVYSNDLATKEYVDNLTSDLTLGDNSSVSITGGNISGVTLDDFTIVPDSNPFNTTTTTTNPTIDSTQLIALNTSVATPTIVKLPLSAVKTTKSLTELGATTSMGASAVTALNTAISSAYSSGIRRIDGMDKTYTITGATGISIPQGMDFYNFGIDMSGMNNSAIGVSVIGTQAAGVLLTADANVSTNIVSIASTSSFARGDLVYLSDTTIFWSTTPQGQLNRVLEVISATQLRLERPLLMTFTTAASARIAKLTSGPGRTAIRDFYIFGGADNAKTGQIGVRAQYVDGIDIINAETRSIPYSHLDIYRTWDAFIQNPDMRRATDTGLAYGITCTFGSAGLRVIGGQAADMRHAVTTGGGSAGGINHDILVQGMVCRGMTNSGLDCHPQTINATYRDNVIHGGIAYGSENKEGIMMQGINMFCLNNRLTGIGGSSAAITMQPVVSAVSYFNGGTCEVSGNIIDTVTGIGAYYEGSFASVANVVMRNNHVRNADVGNTNGALYVKPGPGKSVTSVIVEGNTVDTASYGVVIRANGAGSSIDNIIEDNNTLRNITLSGVMIYTDGGTIGNIQTGGGSVKSSGGNAARYLSASAAGVISSIIVNPARYDSNARGLQVLATGAGSVISDLMVRGGYANNQTSENFYFLTSSSGVITRAQIGGCRTNGGTNGIRVIGVSTLIIDGSSVHVGNTPWNIDATTAVKYLKPDVGVTTQVTVTTDYTVVDGIEQITSNRGATNTLTLPSAAAYPRRQIRVRTIQAFTVVSASSNVVPVTDSAAGTAILPATDGAWALLESDGTNWIIVAKG